MCLSSYFMIHNSITFYYLMEHEVCNVLQKSENIEDRSLHYAQSPLNIENLWFSILLDFWKYWNSDFSGVLGSWKYYPIPKPNPQPKPISLHLTQTQNFIPYVLGISSNPNTEPKTNPPETQTQGGCAPQTPARFYSPVRCQLTPTPTPMSPPELFPDP